MDSKYAHQLYTELNNDGKGFALTKQENALVSDEITAAGLTIAADHGDGLYECHERTFFSAAVRNVWLIGGDGSRRNAWAVIIPSRLLTEEVA